MITKSSWIVVIDVVNIVWTTEYLHLGDLKHISRPLYVSKYIVQCRSCRIVVQCTSWCLIFHNKCVNVDLRGFRTKKSSWQCNSCANVASALLDGEEVVRERAFSEKDSALFTYSCESNVISHLVKLAQLFQNV